MIQRSLLDGNDIEIIVNHMPIARNLRLGMFQPFKRINVDTYSQKLICNGV